MFAALLIDSCDRLVCFEFRLRFAFCLFKVSLCNSSICTSDRHEALVGTHQRVSVMTFVQAADSMHREFREERRAEHSSAAQRGAEQRAARSGDSGGAGGGAGVEWLQKLQCRAVRCSMVRSHSLCRLSEWIVVERTRAAHD